MKGWVYVISNPAMPGLVKVGHSTKDPQLRAQELNHTGSPHPYLVDYEMLVDEPFRVEQQVHKALSGSKEKKEWFRCSSEEAIAVIKRVAGPQAIHETFKRADREKAERLREEREVADSRQRTMDALLQKNQQDVRSKYEEMLAVRFPPRPFWGYWVVCSIGSLILIVLSIPKISDAQAFWAAVIGGALAAVFLKSYIESNEKESFEYKMIVQERESKLEEARRGIIASCRNPSCQLKIRFDLNHLLSKENTIWTCPKCKTRIDPLQI